MSRVRVSSELLLSALVLLIVVGGALGLGLNAAQGDETVGAAGPEPGVPTAAQTKEFLESGQALPLGGQGDTNLQAAQAMPHRDLERGEALELAEAVFEPELEAAGGIFEEIEPRKYLSDYAAVVPASSLPEGAGAPGGSFVEEHPNTGVLVESSLPLRTENAEGEEEAVDLSLEPSEGELRPQNPLTEVGIPGQLGEGVTLPGPEVEVTVVGAPASLAPSDVEGEFAFYPEVAEDTDLIVEPTARGVETMTDVRSAEAPTATTYQLSLPPEATLKASPHGGAEVVERGKATLVIPPATATDAAGNPVPVEMEVEGDDLKVAISPGPSTAYPVLVDPWYNVETWCWAWCTSEFPGWSSSTTNSSYLALPFAPWMPEWRGLDITSGYPGPAYSGTHADWSYWVPRYAQDMATFKSPPTTWVTEMRAEGVLFLPSGNTTNWPALLVGLVEPGVGWAGEDRVHYGGEGEISNWPTYELFDAKPNVPQNTNIKGADMNLVTYEYEAQAKYRDAFIGAASVYVADVDAPRVLSLEAPKGWVTGVAAGIGYGFEDTGLGVRAAGIRLRGESELHAGWGADFLCTGTSASPCPRKPEASQATSTLGFIPNQLPTGEDELEVVAWDPLHEPGHEASGAVTVKVDDSAPEVELSGPLTEQAKLGTHKTEYALTIGATDGTVGAPQSGVKKVEVKVDGVTKSTFTPTCSASENCSFSGSWTLKASEYAVGAHEVEVLATDALGNVSSTPLEIETGQGPPQTSFTSSLPTYTGDEVTSVGFKATREGLPVEGATFKCSLLEATKEVTTSCVSPFALPEHLGTGMHTLLVTATDKAGKTDPTPARWRFDTDVYAAAPANEKLVFPEVGKKTASYYTLEAEWGPNPEGKAGQGVSGVTFQMKLPSWPLFKTVPVGCTIDGEGHQVSWPLKAQSNPGHDKPVYLKVRGCPVFQEAGYPEKEIQFRAVFDGGEKVAGASEASATEFVYRYNANAVSTDATESVGPAGVDLLTGAMSLSRTDVSIPVPGYKANLEFTRTYSSTIDRSKAGYSAILGGAWQPASPLESEYQGEAWTRIEEQVIKGHGPVEEPECWPEWEEDEEGHHYNEHQECEMVLVEEAQPEEKWIELFNGEGASIPFELTGPNWENIVSPEYAKEIVLRREGTNIVLGYPNGTRTKFEQQSGSRIWLPKFISFQANSQSMRMEYAMEEWSNSLRLVKEIAPAPAVSECEKEGDTTKRPGCRTLMFTYSTGLRGEVCGSVNEFGCPHVLESISYFGPSGKSEGIEVAHYYYKSVPRGVFMKPEEILVAEKDPRVSSFSEWYGYSEAPGETNLLTGLVPLGQEPWGFGYEHAPGGGPNRLAAVARATGPVTTIAYEVPVKGAGAPYDMSAGTIATWGQSDLPVDATAIFPPNHRPTEYPPHGYTGATIHYMDPEGHEVNTASPSPPGVSGSTIATTETNVHGNVVRELDPQNRLTALAAPEPVSRSHELDSHFVYSANGNEMLESWGPLHKIRLASGELEEEVRQHTTTRYDEGAPAPAAGMPPAYLPTKETVAAVVPGKAGELEPRMTETHYNWTFRLPEETIVDPAGLDIRSKTLYNAAGQVEETRQPKGAAGGSAGDTRTTYYTAGPNPENAGCGENRVYANLPCVVWPAKQASGGATRPELLVTAYTAYDYLGQPETVTEAPAAGAANQRITYMTYDSAGRQLTSKTVGGGVTLARHEAKTETTYDPESGLPTSQQFVCEGSGCTGFDNQSTKETYNKLGQVTKYEDADGAVTETTYDAYGRPTTVKDPRGTETMHYDETSGVLTSMEVSGVGTFTAHYDADGNLIERGLPNGLTAKTTFNQAGEPMKLTYTKSPETYCGGSCTWYEESLERSIEGRILYGTSTLVKDGYRYDKAGRLTEAQETPAKGLPEEGKCTSRAYAYDADSNRLTKTTRPPGVGGACATSGGSTESYGYDEADRLEGPSYDPWGRITSLPAKYAGGKELKTTYFANDMVATQEQNGVTNTFQLDSSGRQRQREQTGGVGGIEIFHYDGPVDSPSWTALGSTWSRNVTGIGGELAAIQESSGTTTFKLTDLHGDVVASASSSPTATKLLATYRSDEFGEPESGSAGRFGWLGGKSRRTELSSGVIQMGARSYIPQLGRFLTPDPEPGGSANAYDYSNQDPVNSSDLTGLKPYGRNPGFIHAGIHIWSPKGRKGGTHGTMKVRLFTRMECHTCGPTKGIGGEVHVGSVKVTLERGVGSGNVVESRPIKSPTLEGEMPWGWGNWNKGRPIEFACEIGQEYKVTLAVVIDVTFGRTETESVSAEEFCGHGRY